MTRRPDERLASEREEARNAEDGRGRPQQVEGKAAIRRGRAMPLEERRSRWRDLAEDVQTHGVTAWRDAFVEALNRPRPQGGETPDERPQAPAERA